MKHAAAILTRIALFACCLALTSCAGYTGFGYGSGYGPPPHAPANGYRYNYHGHNLVYDSSLGVYVVIGQSGVYYYNGLYYRHNRDRWYYSSNLNNKWRAYRGHHKLPPGLAKKYRR